MAEYEIGTIIGQGSWGIVYNGRRTCDGKQVAIKFEPCTVKIPQLAEEYRIYGLLKECEYIPNVYYFGKHGPNFFFTMDLLGPSLEDLFQRCGRKFTLKTVVMAGKQMVHGAIEPRISVNIQLTQFQLSRLKELHGKGFIYRDIKPDNFVVSNNHIYLIDLAMAKQYRNTANKHIPFRNDRETIGTARYMSIHSHLRYELSRRDDIQSLWYVLLYFLRGYLPWQGIKADKLEGKSQKIHQKKQETTIEDLCIDLPIEFERIGQYVHGLDFEQLPDYEKIQKLLSQALENIGGVEDDKFEWINMLPTSGNLFAQPFQAQEDEVPPRDTIYRSRSRSRSRSQSRPTDRGDILAAMSIGCLRLLTLVSALTPSGKERIYQAQHLEALHEIIRTVGYFLYLLKRSERLNINSQEMPKINCKNHAVESNDQDLLVILKAVLPTAKKAATEVLQCKESKESLEVEMKLIEVQCLVELKRSLLSAKEQKEDRYTAAVETSEKCDGKSVSMQSSGLESSRRGTSQHHYD